MTAAHPIPIVIDTDTGTDVDDALAIAFALASPELELRGITIVDGDVDVRARMVARLLGMAGRTDIPIVTGASAPLGPGRMPTWFGHEGKGCLDIPYDGPTAPILDAAASEWLVETARVDPYHLIAIGPFTNVAEAARRDPSFPATLRGLTVMGGMAHAESYLPAWHRFFADTGMPPAHMDHNTASDPTAALEVARAGFGTRWVTAELTFCTPLHEAAIDRFEASGSELGACLGRMMRIWAARYFHVIPRFPEYPNKPFPSTAVACLHDPLTVASVFGGPWLKLRPHRLEFGIEDPLFRMWERSDEAPAHATNDVSVSVDAAAFERFFVDRVGMYLDRLAHPASRGGGAPPA